MYENIKKTFFAVADYQIIITLPINSAVLVNQAQPFKEVYSIQDLENLTGIQAHTIRIWEKRYDLLHPSRSGNNIRHYSLKDLQKLLNISSLYQHGHKISSLAGLSEINLLEKVKKETEKDQTNDYASLYFKQAMLGFNQRLFDQTWEGLLQTRSFREIFSTICLPLLHEIGIMWQTNTISVAHEHFLSNLIKQKILLQIERIPTRTLSDLDPVFVLYLPENELHEMGLLYSHYELLERGYHSIYLGQSVPLIALSGIQAVYKKITLVSSFTTTPADTAIDSYLKEVARNYLRKGHDELWVSGRKIIDAVDLPVLKNVRYITSPVDFLTLLSTTRLIRRNAGKKAK